MRGDMGKHGGGLFGKVSTVVLQRSNLLTNLVILWISGKAVTDEERIRGALKNKWDVGASRGTVVSRAEIESSSPSSTRTSAKANAAP